MIIRTENEQFKVPFLRDNENNVYCLDSEGAPLKISKKKEELQTQEEGSDVGKADFVKSPMPGTVVKIYCKVGQEVKKNEPLISVESMKMEFMIRATHDVKVKEIRVNEAKFVQMGERMIIFESENEEKK
jgi:biotin carboxyl carrier protein